MEIRKATFNDLNRIAQIYSGIHTCEEQGEVTIGWVRDVYPTYATAAAALERDDLFVGTDDGVIVAAAIINQVQVAEYVMGDWEYSVPDDKVTVLHTLTVSPNTSGKGYGKEFVKFYEEYARNINAPYLRIDTNVKNERARAMYAKMGYREVGCVPCEFNGIKGVEMVLLEKYAGGENE